MEFTPEEIDAATAIWSPRHARMSCALWFWIG